MSITAIPSSTFSQLPISASSSVYQKEFSQLGQDLKSGNLSAAQQDYTTLQKNLQNPADPAPRMNHHQHVRGGLGQAIDQTTSQLLSQLGQYLSAGNLSAAQQAYSNLQTQSPLSTIGTQPAIEPPVLNSPVSISA